MITSYIASAVAEPLSLPGVIGLTLGLCAIMLGIEEYSRKKWVLIDPEGGERSKKECIRPYERRGGVLMLIGSVTFVLSVALG